MKRLALILGIIILLVGAWPAWADWSTPVNLGPGVNTSGYEWASSLSVSGDTLYFNRIDGTDDDNLYMSVFRGNHWDTAVSLGDSINTTNHDENTPFISYDGERLYFSRKLVNPSNWRLFYSEKRNGVWQSPKQFEATFNYEQYTNGWPCFTHDGRRLYFYWYNHPGGQGLGDLWYSDYDTLIGAWGPPVNLGDSINTSEWDACPSLSSDDQTLYYISDTLPTQTPHICRSRMLNGVWQKGVMFPGIPNYGYGGSAYPCLSSDGLHLFFGGVDLPLPSYGNFDIYDSRWVVGVEELSSPRLTPYDSPIKVSPNPFTSFATLPGHEAERFVLYDIAGRKVGTWRGDRIGEGLAPGVYFLRGEADVSAPVRTGPKKSCGIIAPKEVQNGSSKQVVSGEEV